MKKIIWIDDDINRPELRVHRDVLGSRYQIVPIEDPDTFMHNIDVFADCQAIIIDLSLPMGHELTPRETAFGTRAGFALLKKIVEKKCFNKCKKIIFTIVDAPEVREYCQGKGIEYIDKCEYDVIEFARKIDEIVNK